MDKKYTAVLKKIQNFFGIGKIYDVGNKTYYRVTKISDLINVIIPQFKSFPLLSKKNTDLYCME